MKKDYQSVLGKPRGYQDVSIDTILVFLDDERTYKDVTWCQWPKFQLCIDVITYKHFCSLVDKLKIQSPSLEKHIFSFDHDIQDFENGVERTGLDCLKYLLSVFPDIDVKKIYVHTKNVVGQANLVGCIAAHVNSKLIDETRFIGESVVYE